MTGSLEKTMKNCECSPWFYTTNQSICLESGLKCFNENMRNESRYLWSEKCPPPCEFTEYDLRMEEKPLKDSISELKGNVMESYFSQENLVFQDFAQKYSDWALPSH